MKQLSHWFPIVGQLNHYSREKCTSDIIAAIVVTVMLIPQSLAYAILAGLPPHYGLYASILPIVIYSVLGTSTSLAVGPVAIASIMTASALSSVVSAGMGTYVSGAITLALLSGGMLFSMGLLRLGFIANFLSHSVVSGFITASAFIIALGQFRHVLGVNASGHNFIELGTSLLSVAPSANAATAAIGFGTLLFLLAARYYAKNVFAYLGASNRLAASLAKMSPIIAVVITTALVAAFSLDTKGVAIVGEIPSGILNPNLPDFNWVLIESLIAPAFFISIIGYVESISVGRTLGAKRDEKIEPNQELIALGGANLASGLAGAFPVTGGFSRSVVNYDAGARTQFAGIYTAIGIAIASIVLTQYLYYLPIAMLAATIIVAVLALIDFSIFKHAWLFSKSDFLAVSVTVLVTLTFGVETGVASGIVISILLHLYHTSRPHIAEIGRIPGTEHFRNTQHFEVETAPQTVSLRIDESLIFSNANYLDNAVTEILRQRSDTLNIVLNFAAINTVDLTGMEMLERLNNRLLNRDVLLHLSEVKMPVKKLLEADGFIERLGGQLYLTHMQAHTALNTQQDTQ